MSNVAIANPPQARGTESAAPQTQNIAAKPGHQRINKVAVLGAGTMGARIAAHFANAGVPCILLDMVPPDAAQSSDKSARNKIVAAGLDAAIKSKPAAFYEKPLERLISIGNFDDDLKLIAEADWIIEAVAENLEINQALPTKVTPFPKPATFRPTNTRAFPIAI